MIFTRNIGIFGTVQRFHNIFLKKHKFTKQRDSQSFPESPRAPQSFPRPPRELPRVPHRTQSVLELPRAL